MGQSHKTVSTDHNFLRERRAKADSNWGPSAYQPKALPLGQTSSHQVCLSQAFSALHCWRTNQHDRTLRSSSLKLASTSFVSIFTEQPNEASFFHIFRICHTNMPLQFGSPLSQPKTGHVCQGVGRASHWKATVQSWCRFESPVQLGFFLSPRVNFQCRLSYSVCTAPVCNCMQRYRCAR